MPHEIPTEEPTEITAATTVQWDRVLAEHPPADGWTLKYAIRGPVDLDVAATVAGDVYQVRITAAETQPLTPGMYRLYGFVERGEDRYVVYDGSLEVLESPIAPVGRATHAETVLAAIDARIEGRLTADLEEVTINGRSVKHIPIGELVRLRGIYAAKVDAERNPGQLGQRVEVWFGRA
ncbi:MAG TPA: hypothetical protein VF158_15900 [Longimicrobiales bacterium]